MTDIYDMLQTMYDTAKKVCDDVYLQDRPSATSSRHSCFIVAELPSVIENKEISQDGSYNDFVTTGQFTIFVKDRTSSKNPNELALKTISSKLKSLYALFPVKDVKRSVKLRKARILIPPTSDERGYHYTIIQFELTTNI